jgi:hypothetical protein
VDAEEVSVETNRGKTSGPPAIVGFHIPKTAPLAVWVSRIAAENPRPCGSGRATNSKESEGEVCGRKREKSGDSFFLGPRAAPFSSSARRVEKNAAPLRWRLFGAAPPALGGDGCGDRPALPGWADVWWWPFPPEAGLRRAR